MAGRLQRRLQRGLESRCRAAPKTLLIHAGYLPAMSKMRSGGGPRADLRHSCLAAQARWPVPRESRRARTRGTSQSSDDPYSTGLSAIVPSNGASVLPLALGPRAVQNPASRRSSRPRRDRGCSTASGPIGATEELQHDRSDTGGIRGLRHRLRDSAAGGHSGRMEKSTKPSDRSKANLRAGQAQSRLGRESATSTSQTLRC